MSKDTRIALSVYLKHPMFQMYQLGDMIHLFFLSCSQLILYNVFQQILLHFQYLYCYPAVRSLTGTIGSCIL